MSRKSDYKPEKNPLLVVLYIAVVLLLLGCIAFFVLSSKERRKTYEDQIKQAAEGETEYSMTERIRETESETENSGQEKTKSSGSGAAGPSKGAVLSGSDKKNNTESESEGQSEQETAESEESETAESESETESAETAERINVSFAEKTQTILVLNGTRKPGVAGNWKEQLEKLGYRKVVSASYNGEIEDNTVIYAESDALTEGLQHEFRNSVMKEGKVESGIEAGEGETLPDQVDVYVVVGRNDAVIEAGADSE